MHRCDAWCTCIWVATQVHPTCNCGTVCIGEPSPMSGSFRKVVEYAIHAVRRTSDSASSRNGPAYCVGSARLQGDGERESVSATSPAAFHQPPATAALRRHASRSGDPHRRRCRLACVSLGISFRSKPWESLTTPDLIPSYARWHCSHCWPVGHCSPTDSMRQRTTDKRGGR